MENSKILHYWINLDMVTHMVFTEFSLMDTSIIELFQKHQDSNSFLPSKKWTSKELGKSLKIQFNSLSILLLIIINQKRIFSKQLLFWSHRQIPNQRLKTLRKQCKN
jgi:hypothetical protein